MEIWRIFRSTINRRPEPPKNFWQTEKMNAPDVVAAIFHEQGRILLQYRISTPRWPLHWGLPAGGVESNETGPAAISREMMEELGVTFNPRGEPEFSCISEGGKRFDAYVVRHYLGRIVNNESLFCGELGWFDLNELPEPLTSTTSDLLRFFRDTS